MMVDWQLAAQGKGVLDVAYFLIRSVPSNQRQQIEQDLLRTYHSHLIQNGVRAYDFAQCWADYQRAFFWPLLTVVVSVAAGDTSFLHKLARFRTTLERLTAFIEDHAVERLL